MDTVPFGEWTPDHASFHHEDMHRASEALGVYATTEHSYAPFPTFQSVSNALTARCQGAIGVKDASGNGFAFAGDATKLYRRTGVTWANVSRTATTYACGSEENWTFVEVGDQLVALNIGDYPQVFTLSSSSLFDNLAASTDYLPKARYGAQIGDHLMLGNLNDVGLVGLGLAPKRLWWCGKGDITDWPEPGTSAAAAAQAGFSAELPGGWIQGITRGIGGAAGVVLSEDALHRVLVAGPPNAFDFDFVEGARGAWVASSILNFGRGVIYLTEDGWYVFDGSTSVPIGARRIDRWFLDRLDTDNRHRISVVPDPERKLVVISFPGEGSTGGTPNELLIWNWDANKWSHASGTVETLFRDRTAAYTLEDLDAFGTLDALPYSLDSRFWSGGASQIGAFDTAHKSGNFAGPAQAASMITQDFDAKGRRIFVSGFRPIVDGGTVTGGLVTRESQDGAATTTPLVAPEVDGICRIRAEGRYVRARVDVAAGGSWTHALGVQVGDEFVVLTGGR